jgi:hypothetical protein
VARYATPDGHLIQARGIRPDIVVPHAAVEPRTPRRVREAALEAALDADTWEGPEPAAIRGSGDHQLDHALNLLAGLARMDRIDP